MGNNFLLVLIISIASFLILIIIINEVVSRWLGVKKKSLFSYQHVNDRHKKIEWAIRITFIIFIVIGTFVNIHREPSETLWFLETWNILIVFIVIVDLLQAFMEWKYVENKKVYISTLIQLGFFVVLLLLLFVLIMNNFFGLI
ncbi:DUF4181 domain-containing protein [Ureibacillus manganicus]|nr:DUF4181 domain-containing protein [Ureibacillus manganicus]